MQARQSAFYRDIDLSFLIRWAAVLISGTSLIYVLSAAFVLLGVQRLLPDFVVHDPTLWQKLQPVAAVHAYELALLAVLGLVAVWKRVYDDAISLSLLGVMFLVASAATLNMFPPEGYDVALSFGAAGLVLAGIKGWAFWPRVVGRVHPLAAGGIVLLLGANFLLPGLLELGVYFGEVNEVLLPWWLAGWWVVIVASFLLFASSMAEKPVELRQSDESRAFLQTSLMRWLLLTVLLVSSVAHLYAVKWVIILPVDWGDLLMPGTVLISLWLRIRAAYTKRWTELDHFVVLLFLGAVWAAMLARTYHYSGAVSWSLVCYPPAVAFVGAGLLALLAWTTRRRAAAVWTMLFVVTGSLWWGAAPEVSGAYILHNLLSTFGLMVLVTISAAIWKRWTWLFGAVWVQVGVAVGYAALRLGFADNGVFVCIGLLAGSYGMLLSTCASRRGTQAWWGWTASLIAVGATMGVVNGLDRSILHGPIEVVFSTILMIVFAAAFTRCPALCSPLVVPGGWLVMCMIRAADPGWLFVVAGFVTLCIGAVISIHRGTVPPNRLAVPPTEPPTGPNGSVESSLPVLSLTVQENNPSIPQATESASDLRSEPTPKPSPDPLMRTPL